MDQEWCSCRGARERLIGCRLVPSVLLIPIVPLCPVIGQRLKSSCQEILPLNFCVYLVVGWWQIMVVVMMMVTDGGGCDDNSDR